jgi:transketolase
VLDADLSDDCGLRKFEQTYTDRFFEHGIAEQDMVSMAGGLAAQGFVSVVASFGAFLAARANEQIYNNACERRRIVYLCQYSGLLPAGPGHSHQSVRDVALFGSVPGVDVIQPCNEREARMALRHAVFDATESCMIRLSIIPSPRVIELPADYRLSRGRGCILRSGGHAIMVAYGPVMLDQCLRAAEILAEDGIECCVVNMPWLNRFNGDWLDETMGLHQRILIVDDHGATGGLGERLTAFLAISGRLNGRRVATLAIQGVPICGTNLESLRAHGLNADGIATALRRIQ